MAWRSPLPSIIQGGMGVSVSSWRLARSVARRGQLGVVSGVALEILMARRLQDGDPGGHVRRALAAYADLVDPEFAAWVLDSYFVDGGLPAGQLYKPVPRYTLTPSLRLLQMTVAANFVEVYLAKEGHDGQVGMNYLRKIDLPIPAGCYGAMLAGVDVVLMGAGSPHELPGLVRDLSRHTASTWGVKVLGSSTDPTRPRPDRIVFDPHQVAPRAAERLGRLQRPMTVAIVASHDLAAGLYADPLTRPDGFVVESPTAGGHNAPPRGPRRLDDLGQPVYDARDKADIGAIIGLGLPVWLAGGYANPAALQVARRRGAAGIQVGTAFAYCEESGMAAPLKRKVRDLVRSGELTVRSDWDCSPTGFPFRVAQVDGTLSEARVRQARQPVCDLGVLRTAFQRPDGTIDYRCPAEPLDAFLRKGGRPAATQGRMCLCNALFAAAGHPQRRPGREPESALVTSGSDLRAVAALLDRSERDGYSADDVLDYLTGVG